MTCIAGLVHNGVVYMGADSIAIDHHSTFETANTDKVFIRDDFIYAIAGAWRIRDILQYSFTPPEHNPDHSTDKYMKSTYVQALVKCFEDNKFLTIKDGVMELSDAALLIGYRGELFMLNSDMAMLRCQDWGAAEGSGYQAAFAVLYALDKHGLIDDPETRLMIALEAAEQTIASVRRPFKVLSL